jgi:hypothetical protein
LGYLAEFGVVSKGQLATNANGGRLNDC